MSNCYTDFRKEIEEVVNRCSMENNSDTPDFILAHYLMKCLEAFDYAVVSRESWYSREVKGTPHIGPKVAEEES